MPERDPIEAPLASWTQLEQTVERLHAAARGRLGVREFYRRLLADAAAALGAVGGAAWRMSVDGRLELIGQASDADSDIEPANAAGRRERVLRAFSLVEAEIQNASPGERGYDCLLCPVPRPATADDSLEGSSAVALIELWFLAGGSPLVQQGWLEFAAMIADIAADFHALEELRELRVGAALHRQAVDLLRRVQGPRELEGAAFEVANEGRRVLRCDRLSVLVRRGRRWRLLAASGASRVERRNDITSRMERLANETARWGEPFSYPAMGADDGELPPNLATALEVHIDHSQARGLACAPIAFAPPREDGSKARRESRAKFDVVLVAENFATDGPRGQAPRLAGQLVELGELCGPALRRAAALDRFPVRTLLRWSDRLGALTQPGRLVRNLFIVGALAAAVAALVFVPVDFDVEAPATLATAVQRDVFASATGAVAEIRVSQGQMVHKGDVLVVLSDPELALKLQQTRGEIDAARKRLSALAVTRTDRSLRENPSDDRLPLSAEQRQLEERLASLEAQRQLLESRREALTLRSPLDGQVLTQDVQSLLESRPVERGQALLTIADTSSGWILKTDVPQRQIGHVLTAQQSQQSELAASLRLAGDVTQSYSGHVTAISTAAPLEAEGLEDDAAPVEVEIALDGEATAAARPGMTASVRIHCGKRSLGYVWLHDVGATIYRWLTF